jgi:hypothetical protein
MDARCEFVGVERVDAASEVDVRRVPPCARQRASCSGLLYRAWSTK